ncbi:MAG TPA: sigma-70 family RNA polymerase sigma factor [Verrucomicrobiae bacterium]
MSAPEPNPTQTRASLVQGLQAGDESRWHQFYRLYGPMIRGFALKAGLTETEADEVMQETCIGLAKNVGEFHYDPAKCRFKTWLLNLAAWRVKNQFTKRQRWDERVHGQPKPAHDPDRTATIERAADPGAQNLDALWDEEWRGSLLKTALEKVRAQFSAMQFQVFDLNVLKEWPARDVAKALGLNIASVYLAKHRVSAALKKEIARLEAEMAKVMQ